MHACQPLAFGARPRPGSGADSRPRAREGALDAQCAQEPLRLPAATPRPGGWRRWRCSDSQVAVVALNRGAAPPAVDGTRPAWAARWRAGPEVAR